MSALPPKADMCTALAHVRFGPEAEFGSPQQHFKIDFLDVVDSGQRHADFEFLANDFDRLDNTKLAARTQPVDIRPTNKATFRAKRQRT